MPKVMHSMTKIMRQCGVLGIPYEKVVNSDYAKEQGWSEPNGKSQYGDGKYGKKGKGEKLIPGKDTADLKIEQMNDLLNCKYVDAVPAYWAFLATPNDYNIEDAINDLKEDFWIVKNKKVKKGDRCIIWKVKASSDHRGIIALAEVLDNPVEMFEHPASIKYWVAKYEPSLENRVKVKYSKFESLPIWLEDDNTGILASLSVCRATGGSIFKITPEQWEKLSHLIGFNEYPTKLSNRALLKSVGKSQHQDGVRINKEFHDLFNPSSSNDYVSRGSSRNIIVDFNGNQFKAQYVFEGTKLSDRDLQRIQFSKELRAEFAKVFPTANGYFNIKLGNDLNHFIFSYDSVDEAKYVSELVDEIQKSRRDTREARLKRLASAPKKPESLQMVTVAYKRNADVIGGLSRAVVMKVVLLDAPF
ncbi:MAG: EVE domain-containing protein [Geobacteraceae bacterium]|nr:EVE domain-containing protein [Geobacteraceae bacterium]